MANHFPAPAYFDGPKFLRDTTAHRRTFVSAKRAYQKSVGGFKRKSPSLAGVSYVAKAPRLDTAGNSANERARSVASCTPSVGDGRSKRHKISHKQVEEGDNFRFLEYWLAGRGNAPNPAPPPVSAKERTDALLARVRGRSITANAVADTPCARASIDIDDG